MGEVVNLRQRKKEIERARRESEASENRVRFGRTKAEKASEAKLRVLAESELDGKKIE